MTATSRPFGYQSDFARRFYDQGDAEADLAERDPDHRYELCGDGARRGRVERPG